MKKNLLNKFPSYGIWNCIPCSKRWCHIWKPKNATFCPHISGENAQQMKEEHFFNSIHQNDVVKMRLENLIFHRAYCNQFFPHFMTLHKRLRTCGTVSLVVQYAFWRLMIRVLSTFAHKSGSADLMNQQFRNA